MALGILQGSAARQSCARPRAAEILSFEHQTQAD